MTGSTGLLPNIAPLRSCAMTRAAVLVLATVAAGVSAVGGSVSANAVTKPNCGARIVADWLDDGRVEKLYPLRCYDDALEGIPVDISSTIRSDLARARAYARRGRLAGPSAAWRARHAADSAYRAWSAALRAGAAADRRVTFPNPPVAVLRGRLRSAGRRYGFRVAQLYVKWPRQQAPYIVVSSSNRRSFARAVPAILRLLDPKRDTGWAYEGFYLEARDRSGSPFLVVFNHWRGPHGGGGQWGRNADLYPFAHG